jgi:hypothetical protein
MVQTNRKVLHDGMTVDNIVLSSSILLFCKACLTFINNDKFLVQQVCRMEVTTVTFVNLLTL